MVYIIYFILFFSLLQFFIALSNFIIRPVLLTHKSKDYPLVSVLIPVRNEEKNIANLLTDLQAVEYKNIEIIIYNDQSIDGTVQIIESQMKRNKKIRLLHAVDLPFDWFGKNYGCYHLAQQAKGAYYMFLDADVRIGKKLIQSALYHIKHYNLQFISIFPMQIMVSHSEKIVVPLMNFILLSLLPLFLVKRGKFTSLSAANGQFMLFDAGCYEAMQPHRKMKNKKAEDIAIARYLKKQKYRIDCLTGNKQIKCRMYSNYEEAIEGFSKNVSDFFGGSYIMSIFYWFIATFGIVLFIFSGNYKLLIIYLIITLLKSILISEVSKQSIADNLIYCIPRHIAFGVIIYKSIINKIRKQHQWKGRYIN